MEIVIIAFVLGLIALPFYLVYLLIDDIKNGKKRRLAGEELMVMVEKTRDLVYDYIIYLIDHHKVSLASERNRLSVRDQYGIMVYTKWKKDGVNYFLYEVLLNKVWHKFNYNSALPVNGYDLCFKANKIRYKGYKDTIGPLIDTNSIRKMIDSAATDTETSIAKLHGIDNYSDNMSGVAYEYFCKRILEANGWVTQMTPVTGDQGVDIIASQCQHKIAIQCKKSISSVGNRAVQEIVAGMKHYGVKNAAVVSNSYFTKSAQTLASSNNVRLLHHYELITLYKQFYSPSSESSPKGSTISVHSKSGLRRATFKSSKVQ